MAKYIADVNEIFMIFIMHDMLVDVVTQFGPEEVNFFIPKGAFMPEIIT